MFFIIIFFIFDISYHCSVWTLAPQTERLRRPRHQPRRFWTCTHAHARTVRQTEEARWVYEINNDEVAASNGGNKKRLGGGYLAFHSVGKKTGCLSLNTSIRLWMRIKMRSQCVCARVCARGCVLTAGKRVWCALFTHGEKKQSTRALRQWWATAVSFILCLSACVFLRANM